MSERINVRKSAPRDAVAMGTIYVSSWQAADRGILPLGLLENLTTSERLSRFNEILPMGADQILVAERDGQVIGWAASGASRDDDQHGEVYALFVLPQHWRQGVGASLWRAACESLAKSGYAVANAWVLEANGPASRFYEAMGCELDTKAKMMFERDGHSAPLVRYSLRLD